MTSKTPEGARARRDLIAVRGLEFQARHGATADERRSLRRFQIDIEVERDLSRPSQSDRLADTVDYHALCTIAVEIGTGRTYHLVEALAGAIVAEIARRWPALAICVEVRKLNPPCPGNPGCAAVRIARPAAS